MKEYMSTEEIRQELNISRWKVQQVRDYMRTRIGKPGGFASNCIIMKGKALRMKYVDFIRAAEEV